MVFQDIVDMNLLFGTSFLSVSSVFYMIIRAAIVYILGVLLARFHKKLVGVRNPLNFIVFVMLGSMLATGVIMPEFFLPVVATLFFLLLMNVSVTMLAFYIPPLELLLKGPPVELVKNGKILWEQMERNYITKNELLNELQTQLQTRDLSMIKRAILASDGTINFTIDESKSEQ